ncbi:MAG: hypothetical protein AAGK04_11625 [Planctomycetota bacterium]
MSRSASQSEGEFQHAHWISDGLKASASGPSDNLTDRVLDDIGRRRGFLSPRGRRLVRVTRLSVASGVLIGLAVLAVARRADIGLLAHRDTGASIESVERAAQADATGALRTIESLVSSAIEAAERLEAEPTRTRAMVREDLTRLVGQAAAPALGELSVFETPITEGVEAVLAFSPSIISEQPRQAFTDVWSSPALCGELGVASCVTTPLGVEWRRSPDGQLAVHPLALPSGAASSASWLPPTDVPLAP